MKDTKCFALFIYCVYLREIIAIHCTLKVVFGQEHLLGEGKLSDLLCYYTYAYYFKLFEENIFLISTFPDYK